MVVTRRSSCFQPPDTSVGWELAPGATPEGSFGLQLFESGDPEELEERNRTGTLPAVRAATAYDPELPSVLEPGAAWEGEISARGALVAGSWARVVFGTLVAVGKTFPAETLRAAFAAGLRHFGENKVQEAEGKAAALADLRAQGLVWHLVGHLQRNKARKAVALFDRIHSVDGVELAHRLEHAAAEQGRVLPVLVQVDLAGEATKFGLDEQHLMPVLETLRGFKSLRVEATHGQQLQQLASALNALAGLLGGLQATQP